MDVSSHATRISLVGWLLRAIAIAAALAFLVLLGISIRDLLIGNATVSTALAFSAAVIALVVFAQAALHLAGAPAREQMIEETATAVRDLSALLDTKERAAQPPHALSERLSGLAATASRWILFFATRGAAGGLLGAVASALIGALTILVAYQQLVLLTNQGKIMEQQTSVMIGENNARTLEYHLSLLITDIRAAHLADKATQERTWPMLAKRVNVLSKALRPEPDQASKERGLLLATLVAERFRFGESMTFESADLSMLPHPGEMLNLGPVNLMMSNAGLAELAGYDLSQAQLGNVTMPITLRMHGARLRDPKLIPQYTPTPEGVIVAALNEADLATAYVPDKDWLRRLEADVGVENFGQLPWVLHGKKEPYLVLEQPVREIAQAEWRLLYELHELRARCTPAPQPSNACEAGTAQFCNAYSTVARHQALSASQRGSLFAYATFVVSRSLAEDFAALATERRSGLRERLSGCIVQHTFSKSMPVDVSTLTMSDATFDNADLGQITWRGANIRGKFANTLLPGAKVFAEAKIVKAQDGWSGARVIGASWEYELCLATVPSWSQILYHEDEYFPFSSIQVATNPRGNHFLEWSTDNNCERDYFDESAGETRETYCRACAQPSASAF